MKNYNKIIAVAMAGAICGSTAFSSISLAATKSSEKEEVIYANLTSSGDIKKIYAVNIFEDKDIVDYGVYDTVKNMNTMDKINYSNGKVTIQNSQHRKPQCAVRNAGLRLCGRHRRPRDRHPAIYEGQCRRLPHFGLPQR